MSASGRQLMRLVGPTGCRMLHNIDLHASLLQTDLGNWPAYAQPGTTSPQVWVTGQVTGIRCQGGRAEVSCLRLRLKPSLESLLYFAPSRSLEADAEQQFFGILTALSEDRHSNELCILSRSLQLVGNRINTRHHVQACQRQR